MKAGYFGISSYIFGIFWYILVLTPRRVNSQNSTKKLIVKNSTIFYIKKTFLKCHTRVIRKVIRKSHTRRSYTEVIRGAVFQWVLAARRKPYAKAIRENSELFLDILPYAGHAQSHTRRSYTKVIRGAVFQWVLATRRKPYGTVIHGGHTHKFS